MSASVAKFIFCLPASASFFNKSKIFITEYIKTQTSSREHCFCCLFFIHIKVLCLQLSAPLSLGILWARNWSGLPCTPLGDLPRTEPSSSAFQADSLPSESPWEPKNTRVGSLSLLQGRISLLPDPGIEPGSPALQADSLPAELPGKPSLHPNVKASKSLFFSTTVLRKVSQNQPLPKRTRDCYHF